MQKAWSGRPSVEFRPPLQAASLTMVRRRVIKRRERMESRVAERAQEKDNKLASTSR